MPHVLKPDHMEGPTVRRQPVLLAALAAWAASRLVLMLVTYYSGILNDRAAPRNGGFVARQQSLDSLVELWRWWDGGVYVLIAQDGYQRLFSGFFPLWPLLLRAPLRLAPGHEIAVALLMSNLAALGAFAGIALLAAHEAGDQAAARSVWVLASWPVAFFLFAPFSEPLFLALATFSLYFARRGQWYPAAAAAFLASLTRVTGVALFLPLLWELGRQTGWWDAGHCRAQGFRRLLRLPGLLRSAVVATAVPAGLGLFGAYLYRRYGDPLMFLHVQQQYFSRVWSPPWVSATVALERLWTLPSWSYFQALLLLDLGSVMAVVAITLAGVRRLPFSFTLYTLGVVYMAVATPVFNLPDIFFSASRYMLVAFPVFLILGTWAVQRPWLGGMMVGAGFSLQAVLATFFFSGGWVS